jgi:hypothetical protein
MEIGQQNLLTVPEPINGAVQWELWRYGLPLSSKRRQVCREARIFLEASRAILCRHLPVGMLSMRVQ